jgi:hypothetical protein
VGAGSVLHRPGPGGGPAWEEWAADTSPVTLDVPGAGLVEHRSEVTAVDLPFVSFRGTYTFGADGAVITSESTLRFRGREEVTSSLAAAGYRILEVREAPDRLGREHVFITQPEIHDKRIGLLAPPPPRAVAAKGQHPPAMSPGGIHGQITATTWFCQSES